MKNEFDRNKHFEQHKKRIAKTRKEIREKIRQRRKSNTARVKE